MEEVILMAETDVQAAAGHVAAVLREAGRAEATVWRQQVVLERFATFLAGRGLDAASEQVCVDFIAKQTGVRLGSLREPVKDRAVQAVRRPVVLMADALAGRRPDGVTCQGRLSRGVPLAQRRLPLLVPPARQRRGDSRR
jgi:hypothetical protein